MSRRQNTMLSRRWAGGGEDNTDYTLVPLTIKAVTGGVLSIKNENTGYDRNFEYSLNGGAWTAFSLPASSGVLPIATLSAGDTISFRRDNDNFYQAQFVNDSSLTFDLYGNILSLQYGSAFNGQTSLLNTSKRAFGYTFKDTSVVDASKLMLTAPILSEYCYQQLFRGCSLLIAAPALPATTLARSCYQDIFYGCSSLTVAPAISATTLARDCFRSAFLNCAALLSAPSLPVSILAQSCYYRMFDGCSSLNYVKCLATDIAAKDAVYLWTKNVSPTGTFVKSASMNDWPTGDSGIPSGWTVVDATE